MPKKSKRPPRVLPDPTPCAMEILEAALAPMLLRPTSGCNKRGVADLAGVGPTEEAARMDLESNRSAFDAGMELLEVCDEICPPRRACNYDSFWIGPGGRCSRVTVTTRKRKRRLTVWVCRDALSWRCACDPTF